MIDLASYQHIKSKPPDGTSSSLRPGPCKDPASTPCLPSCLPSPEVPPSSTSSGGLTHPPASFPISIYTAYSFVFKQRKTFPISLLPSPDSVYTTVFTAASHPPTSSPSQIHSPFKFRFPSQLNLAEVTKWPHFHNI